jgi:hypothetical protein
VTPGLSIFFTPNFKAFPIYWPCPDLMQSCTLKAKRAAALLTLHRALPAAALPLTFSGSGSSPAGIQATVDAFRADLGTLNPNVAGSFGSGRREINWDAVPDAFAAPNNLPANFFNVNSPRGVVFTTAGTGLQVSANAINPTGTPILFGNINPTYPSLFQIFFAAEAVHCSWQQCSRRRFLGAG